MCGYKLYHIKYIIINYYSQYINKNNSRTDNFEFWFRYIEMNRKITPMNYRSEKNHPVSLECRKHNIMRIYYNRYLACARGILYIRAQCTLISNELHYFTIPRTTCVYLYVCIFRFERDCLISFKVNVYAVLGIPEQWAYTYMDYSCWFVESFIGIYKTLLNVVRWCVE